MSDDGGDDSPPRPKRKIKKVVLISSESESDSDESIAAAATRRKRLRVVSDDGGESSGSSVVAGVRRNRPLPKLRDSDGDSDTSGWATDHSDAPKPAPSAKPSSGFASDSSEGNSDKCSICLLRFTNQEIGTPQSCEHIFCLDCITEWSKNVNTCPVDRMSFDSIVVRAFNGGRVLRTEPVKVVERRPSIELLVTEDPTVCEVCGSTENEETMLLCDGCDLGYHMQCLSPPLLEIPPDQWLCPNCDELLSDVDILFSGMTDAGIDISLDSRQSRGVRSRNRTEVHEPSTSTSHGSSQSASSDFPSTSRGSTSRASGSRASHRRHYRRPRRRRTRTVIIEYEIEENGKFPVTKRVKRKLKKRKTKRRQPRTVARRTHVRASVRAKLATQGGSGPLAAAGPGSLGLRRQRAGIAPLRLFGDPHQLDYFSEEDDPGVSEGATTAVAVRPTAAILSAYRQSRRKMINIPSPPHASAAPDILSSILESQTLLHSKKSVVSVTVDGSVNIKLEKRERQRKPERGERVDPARAGGAAREVPSYPGQSRGGWGGGYRYRDAPGPAGGNYQNNGYGGGYQQQQPRQADAAAGDGRRGPDAYDDYSRRPPQPFAGDAAFDRRREHARFPPQHERRPAGAGPGPWRAYAPPAPPRPSFGAFENPLDMRVARAARPPAPYRPLPEPPVFKFDGPPRLERSEDERSDPDPDLVIDTDKYDPTEPTNDDDSPDEAAQPLGPRPGPAAEAAPRPPPEPELQPQPQAAPQAAPLPAGVLDVAVRQVLQEHRGLLAPPSARSDDDSDGDCPNFSIYSAASVHIANSGAASAPPAPPPPSDGMEDLVQQDDPPDDPPDPPPQPPPRPAPASTLKLKKSDLELKEKVSKRCPITTNPRNPIKIKLNTPSLIRRQVSLYDEEDDADEEPDEEPEPEPVPEPEPAAAPLEGDRRTREPDADEARGNALDERDTERESSREPAEPDTDTKSEEPDERIVPEGQASPGRSPSPEPKSPPTPRDPSPEVGDRAPGSGAECGHSSDDERDAAEHQAHTPTEGGEGAGAGGPHSESSDDEHVEGGRGPRETTAPEKMTESISETEDERSYTPCLDENKSKDTSLETDKDKALEGLDTELISEDETNGVFSDGERPEAKAPSPGATPASVPASAVAVAAAEGGDSPPGSVRRKRKKDAKRDGKDKKKAKREKAAKEVAFKKPSRSGKERNYRDKDRDERERRDSGDAAERKRRRKEKRKDLERYDVRTVVTEKRRRPKDAFGRDVSPRARARSRSASDPPDDARRSPSSPRRPRRGASPTPPRRRSASRGRGTPPRPRRSPTPARRRATSSPRRARRTPSPASPRAPAGSPARPRRRRRDPEKRAEARRRRSPERRKRRRSGSPPRAKPGKRRKRTRSERSSRRRRGSAGAGAGAESARASPAAARSPSRASVDSRLLSPRTPPPEPSPPPEERRRREPERPRHRRPRDAAGPSKEVFTSGDNILVSVSFDDREPEGEARRERRRERRRRRRRAAPEPDAAPRPVAVIDLARSPFRELTPSPRDVIVLSDSEAGAEAPPADAGAEAATPAEAGGGAGAGPGTPPEPPDSPDAYDPYEPTRSASASPSPRPDPPRTLMTLETAQKTNMSADEVIDRRPVSPIEKVMALLQSTRDVSPEPPPAGDAPPAAECEQPPEAGAAPPPALAAPPAPAALLAAPAAPAPAPAPAPPIRIVLPSPTRAQPPKLFLAKPSPIKSDPIKPMQAAKLARPPPRVSPAGDSPYSPGSSDFGDLFSPPGGGGGGAGSLGGERARPRRVRGEAAKVPVKLDRQARRGKTHVGVKVDEDSLKILDDLPSSAVEMQVKSKFLKKLNRQERVVEEVKLVLKPHYNKKHVTKDEYKDILRRAVPKICHNKTGEINPAKIQALVEAYVKKIRKKHKLGLS